MYYICINYPFFSYICKIKHNAYVPEEQTKMYINFKQYLIQEQVINDKSKLSDKQQTCIDKHFTYLINIIT